LEKVSGVKIFSCRFGSGLILFKNKQNLAICYSICWRI